MNQVKEHLFALVKLFELIANMSRLDDEDRYWKLFRIKDKINWIRKELGYEPVKFVKGTNIMLIDDLMDEKKGHTRKRRKPNMPLDRNSIQLSEFWFTPKARRCKDIL